MLLNVIVRRNRKSLQYTYFKKHAIYSVFKTRKRKTSVLGGGLAYIYIYNNVKSGLINSPVLINLLLPQKKMQFKNRWSPRINKPVGLPPINQPPLHETISFLSKKTFSHRNLLVYPTRGAGKKKCWKRAKMAAVWESYLFIHLKSFPIGICWFTQPGVQEKKNVEKEPKWLRFGKAIYLSI